SLRYQKWVDGEHFHVDRLSIHPLEALLDDDEMLAPFTRGITRPASSPIRASASWKWQCACTSIVLIRLPLPVTGRRWPSAPWPRATSRIAQLQNTMPDAPAALIKPRRVVMAVPSLDIRVSCAFTPAARARRDSSLHCRAASPFSFSMPTASTNCVQRAMSS